MDVSNRAVQSDAKVREVKGNLFDYRENQVKENFVRNAIQCYCECAIW